MFPHLLTTNLNRISSFYSQKLPHPYLTTFQPLFTVILHLWINSNPVVAWVGNDPTYADFQSAANPSQLPCHNGWKDRTWTCTSLIREIGATTQRVYRFATYHIRLVRVERIELSTPWLKVTCSTDWATRAYGAEDGTWTRGLALTKRTLYQLSYDSIGASTRIWTADVSLATRSFTPKLYLHN